MTIRYSRASLEVLTSEALTLANGWFREEMRWVGVELGARVAIFRPKETRFFCPLLNRHQTIN